MESGYRLRRSLFGATSVRPAFGDEGESSRPREGGSGRLPKLVAERAKNSLAQGSRRASSSQDFVVPGGLALAAESDGFGGGLLGLGADPCGA